MNGKPMYEELELRVKSLERELRERDEQAGNRTVYNIEQWENRYRVATDESSQILYDWDCETDRMLFGGCFESLLGYSQQELEGSYQRWRSFIHPADLVRVDALNEQHRASKGSFQCVYRVLKKSGEVIHIEETGASFHNDRGVMVRKVGFMRDVSERMRVHEKIAKLDFYLHGLNCADQLLLDQSESTPYQAYVDIIGPASYSERVCVVFDLRDEERMEIPGSPFEWKSETWKTEGPNSPLAHISCDYAPERWLAAFQRGDIISGRVVDFNANECPFVELQCRESICVIPIHIKDKLSGLIVFSDSALAREWEDMGIAYLRSAAKSLAHAMERASIEKQLRRSVNEKIMLLSEVHHRVKNNLQEVASLLNIHSLRISDAQSAGVFRDCCDRVKAMAMVHEALYGSSDLAQINLSGYLEKLCRYLSRSNGAIDHPITICVDPSMSLVQIGMDKGIALGTVLCELVSNAFKHAFPAGLDGVVLIELCESPDGMTLLVVADTGIGMPDDFECAGSSSLGLRLVSSMVENELDGRLEVERGQGTRFLVHFRTAGHSTECQTKRNGVR